MPNDALAQQVRGTHRKLGAVVYAELVEDPVEIDLHRAFGDPKLGADVAIAEALADELDELTLARRQGRRPRDTFLHMRDAVGDFGIDPALALAHLLHAIEQEGGIRRLEHDAFRSEAVRYQQLAVVHACGEQDDRGRAPA